MTYITSQRFRDQAIVDEKIAAKDFEVTYYEVPGTSFAIVVDGHHSLEAAKQCGVPPVWRPVPRSMAMEYDEVFAMDQELGFEMLANDDDWHDALTGVPVF